jgi:hypothetical protein
MPKSNDDSAPAFDRQFVASISSSSTALGQCLRSALVQMTEAQPQIKQQEQEEEEEEEPMPKRIRLDSEAVDSIIQSFGESMADTQMKSNESSSIADEDSAAPRALLHARLDHYNRVGQNWRLVVDNVEVKKRHPLLKERPRRRKKVSFFRSDNESASSVAEEIQILAYNDL